MPVQRKGGKKQRKHGRGKRKPGSAMQARRTAANKARHFSQEFRKHERAVAAGRSVKQRRDRYCGEVRRKLASPA